MRTDVSEEMDRLVSLIVAEARPLRVILFGSAARGGRTADSDIDLLVVMPDGTHRLHTMQRLCGRIRGVSVPFDILVATVSDLEAHGDAPGSCTAMRCATAGSSMRPDSADERSWLASAHGDLAPARVGRQDPDVLLASRKESKG